MKRVVTFGEIMLRLSPPRHERLFQSPELRTYFGGSEANTAASIAQFGLRSDWVSRVPANAVGEAALRALRAEGVGTSHVVRGGERLGIYFVEPGVDLRPLSVVYDRAGSAVARADPAEFAWASILDGADWFHVSGITPALGENLTRCTTDAVSAARAAGATTSIDLNYRPALWGGRDPVPVLRSLVARTDVLIGNPGSVKAMLDIETEGARPESPESLHRTAERVHREFGCRTIALTQREVLSASEHGWSATLYDAGTGELHTSRRFQVRLVDRVGGGDSFAAGLIYALLSGRTGKAALEFATAASALKLTIPGDFNRVSEAEVEQLMGASGT